MIERIRMLAQAAAESMTEWRRTFHAHPELSFREVETTARIKGLLEEMGYSGLRVGTAGIPTGLVAELDTGRPGPCIALRAGGPGGTLNALRTLIALRALRTGCALKSLVTLIPLRADIAGTHECEHTGLRVGR